MSLYNPEILIQYEKLKAQFASAASAMKLNLQDKIFAANIRLYDIHHRLKTDASLIAKASRPDRTYKHLFEITDLVGLRIVTAFEDSIEEVAVLIESNYKVDLNNSHNKILFEDHERFGYRSLHYVCFFPESFSLPKGAKFEIQVRTALQDVWAELEHDLGYKASDLASAKLRRRFSRVSSLLEIAEEELVNIRRELNNYVTGQRENSRLDVVTVKDLASHDTVRNVDQEIALLLQLKISSEDFFPDYLVTALQAAGLETGQEVLQALNDLHPRIIEFIPTYFKFAEEAWNLKSDSLKTFPRGYCLLFLAHVYILQTESLAVNRLRRFSQFYAILDYATDQKKAHDVANILMTYL